MGILSTLPARKGHFLLESGYHSDMWLTLDALFVEPARVAPLVDALASALRPYQIDAVCGPLLGGAFLAQALATTLRTAFYYTEPRQHSGEPGLFAAAYSLPAALHATARGKRVAVVDDVISAGSSVRATVAALEAAGATPVVVASLLVLGNKALDHFAAVGIPVEALERRTFTTWEPAQCPLCRAGEPLINPQSAAQR
jgi:orotate phosphoribosyltransferase